MVGAGLTGSLTASLLAKARPSLSLTVWDKARGAGGRASTHRDPAHPSLHVDMGAQYLSRFSTQPRDPAAYRSLRDETYSELLQSRIVQPLDDKIEGETSERLEGVEAKYVAPAGMSSIARHFLNKSRATVVYQHQLHTVHSRGSRVVCETSSGMSASFDAVVLTMPAPQILALCGNILDNLDTSTRSNLESVRYSSRYALGLVTESLSQFRQSCEWAMKYVDHPVIRFLSWGQPNAGGGENTGQTLLVHTSVPFTMEHLETDKPLVEDLVMAALAEVLPGFPWQPCHTHLVRWRYSQVQSPFPGTPGFCELSRQPLVLASGDGFVGSNFENCLRSAQKTTDHILTHS